MLNFACLLSIECLTLSCFVVIAIDDNNTEIKKKENLNYVYKYTGSVTIHVCTYVFIFQMFILFG